MPEIIEVCGKMCVVGNVYAITYKHNDLTIYGFYRLSFNGFQEYSICHNYNLCDTDAVISVSGVNGEVLEDAPFKPKKGEWCVFGDKTVRRFVDMKGDLYCDDYGFKWNMCKPVSPELAAILKKELD